MKNKEGFQCSACGECCRHIGKIEQLRAFDNGNGVCIHLKGNLCEIYENRPEIYDYDEIQYNKYNMANRSTSISNSDIHYYGDLCCYSENLCEEQSIQMVDFRFNTMQRECSNYIFSTKT